MKQLLKLTGCLAVAGLFASCQSAQQEADYQIIPMPQEIVTASGNPCILKSSVKILYPEGNENMQRNAKFLADYLKTARECNCTGTWDRIRKSGILPIESYR